MVLLCKYKTEFLKRNKPKKKNFLLSFSRRPITACLATFKLFSNTPYLVSSPVEKFIFQTLFDPKRQPSGFTSTPIISFSCFCV